MKNKHIARFQAKAKELLPQHDELRTLDITAFTCEPQNITPSDLEDYYRITYGEYLDGMAATINAILEAEDRA